jgi:hypothetical protein
MKKYIFLILTSVFIFSCSEDEAQQTQDVFTVHGDVNLRSGLTAENYVYVYKNERVQTASNTLLIIEKFFTSDYSPIEIGDLLVTDEFDENNLIEISELSNPQFLPLVDYGQSKEVSIGSDSGSVYFPQDIDLVIEGIDLQSPQVKKTENLQLTWTVDESNPNEKISILIYRQRSGESIGFPLAGFPIDIQDEGTYTINSEVFSDFNIDDRILIEMRRYNEAKVGQTAFKLINVKRFLGRIKP